MTDQLSGPLISLRPVGSTYRVTLPGNGIDPRSLGHLATYEIVGHIEQSPGVFREDVRRIRFEKLPP